VSHLSGTEPQAAPRLAVVVGGPGDPGEPFLLVLPEPGEGNEPLFEGTLIEFAAWCGWAPPPPTWRERLARWLLR